MSGPKLIIKQQKSPLVIALCVCACIVTLISVFYIGRYLAVGEREQYIEKATWLQEKLDKYQLAYQQANENLVMQKQSSEVDVQSSQQLVDNIKKLQENQAQLEDELKFYRNIMAPELDQNGLTIADFELNQKSSAFKLVLTQAGKQEQFLKGEVKLRLYGKLNGKPKDYAFRELGTFQAKDFQFQFKYFQNIEGVVNLPQGFVAEMVSVSATTKGLRKNQSTQKEISLSL